MPRTIQPTSVTQGDRRMKVEYINPFIAATVNVFDTMVGTELHRGSPIVERRLPAQP